MSLRSIGVALGYAILACLAALAATWPLAANLDTVLIGDLGHPDVQVGALWWPGAVADSLRTGAPLFHRAELAYPVGQDVRLFVWNFALQVILAPVVWVSGDPIRAANALLIAVLTLDGLACAALGEIVTGRRVGGVAGLLVGATSFWAVLEAGVGHLDQAFFAPIALFFGAIVWIAREPGRWRGRVLGAASLALAGAVYWFYAIFLGLLTLLLLVWWAARRELHRASVVDLLVVGVGAVVLVAPFAWPVLDALTGQSGLDQTIEASIDTASLRPNFSLVFPDGLLGPLFPGEGPAWYYSRTSLLTVPLLMVAAWRGGAGVRGVSVAGLAGVVFAMGTHLYVAGHITPGDTDGSGIPLPFAALDALPGFDRFRWPNRWLGVVVAARAAAAAWVVSRVPGSWLVVGALGLFLGAETQQVLRGGGPMQTALLREVPDLDVWRALGEVEGDGPLLQLPLGELPNSYVGLQRLHHKALGSGIAWQFGPQIYGEQVAKYREPTPLWRALAMASEGVEHRYLPQGRSWTEEETGGFHYVALFCQRGADVGRGPSYADQRGAVIAVLGAPFYEDIDVTVWAIPGVGVVPARYAPASADIPDVARSIDNMR